MNRRLLSAGAVVAALLALPAGAAAHAQLISATPADGVTVAAAPTTIRLAFSEPVVASRSSLDLYGSDGRRFHLEPSLTVATLIADVPRLADGTYRLVWKTLSADDLHVVGGEVVSCWCGDAGARPPRRSRAAAAARRGADPMAGARAPRAPDGLLVLRALLSRRCPGRSGPQPPAPSSRPLRWSPSRSRPPDRSASSRPAEPAGLRS